MKKPILLIAGLLCLVSAATAQVTKVCFNEVLVTNHTNYVDDYGQKVPWFELFNASYNEVNIGGCYLSNDINNPKMYMIPKGDVLTEIPTRQHVLFYADNLPDRGTFHVNFTLDSATTNTLYLFNADGRSLIDSVTVPVLAADVSWGCPVDGVPEWTIIKKVTPSTNNLTLDTNEKVDRFAEMDPNGAGMAMVAMGVVFSVLLVCAISFLLLAYVIKMVSRRRQMRKARLTNEPTSIIDTEDVPGEVIAAISLALHQLNEDTHDEENTILTIAKTRRAYSPWSSKIYGLRQLPK
ncbi:MAG: lamin tail domain-containing protein [Bacteroidales bacterium]|jgi:Na+-transporting methylmalonyl-CoA/oxaloacetate decarboxylase gamma subunit|nr:lamin tail domain-containing protein [Bacteroidales bacterium]